MTTHICPECQNKFKDQIPRTLETTLEAKDIRKLKQDKIFTKQVFVTTLVLKYKAKKYTKKDETP